MIEKVINLEVSETEASELLNGLNSLRDNLYPEETLRAALINQMIDDLRRIILKNAQKEVSPAHYQPGQPFPPA